MRTSLVAAITLISITALLMLALRGPSEGTAGTSLTIGGDFVMIEDGYHLNEVTFMVVRNWPISSTPSDRLNDDRFDLMGIPPTIRLPDGGRRPVDGVPHVYFYDSNELTMFPVRMTQDDIATLHGQLNQVTEYRQILALLRRYEAKTL